MKDLKRKLAVIRRGYGVLHGLMPRFMPLAAVQAALGAFLPFINIFMSAQILNALTARREMQHVLLLAGITVALNYITSQLQNALQRVMQHIKTNAWNLRERPLNEKQQTMDYAHLENPDVRLMREKMMTLSNTNGRGIFVLHWTFEGILRNLFTVIFAIFAFAAVFAPSGNGITSAWGFLNSSWASVTFVALILGNCMVGLFMISKQAKKEYENVSVFHHINRVGNVYYRLIVNQFQIGKELRLYRLDRFMRGFFRDLNTSFMGGVAKWQNTNAVYNSLLAVISCAFSALAYAFVAVKAVIGGLAVGSIVQYVGGITRLNDGLAGLANSVAQVFSSVEAMEIYFAFLDLPDKQYHGTLPVEKRSDNEYVLEFCNVSFKYPSSEAYALRNLDLKLKVGERLAVVGMNGSGKTTMIKLLCRLYDPTEGEITLNGIDIRKYDYVEYMSLFGVVFQDFQLFGFPLGQNVAASVEVDKAKAEKCLQKAGFGVRLATMPRGLETELGKDFDRAGVEISGGEAQKIALARALYKDAPFMVLDEPTAALDPIAEFEVYAQFNDIVGGKTAVFISHRLSSCRFCHDIAVFHEGRLVQRGGHDDLLAMDGGKYHELWCAQAQYYTNAEYV